MKRDRIQLRCRLFSLMEIMVVLIIIGLVLGLVGPALMEKLEAAKVKTAKNQIQLLEGCVTSYYLDMGDQPDSLQALATNPSGSNKWKGPYVAKGVIPKDPWGNEYQYSASSNHTGITFEIISYGKDKSAGGDGFNADIGNWPDEE